MEVGYQFYKHVLSSSMPLVVKLMLHKFLKNYQHQYEDEILLLMMTAMAAREEKLKK